MMGNVDIRGWQHILSFIAIALGTLLPFSAFGAMNANFDEAVSISTESIQPRGFAIGDIDNDGNEDLVIESGTEGLPAVFLDIYGDAAYGIASSPDTEAGNILSAALGDLDGDGDLDLVTAGPDTVYYWDGANSEYVKANSADGYGAESFQGRSVLIADFDEDGKSDILWFGSNFAYLGLNSTVAADAIQIAAPTRVNSPEYYTGVLWSTVNGSATGDFNDDGHVDFVAGNNWNFNATARTYHVGMNDGNGAFAVSSPTQTGVDPYIGGAVAVGDFNGDGKDDFALSRAWGRIISGQYQVSGRLHVYLRNAANDGFDNYQISDQNAFTYSQLVVADMDGDTHLDIVAHAQGLPRTDIYLNNGSGYFASAASANATFPSTQTVAVRDMNGDDVMDVIAPTTNNLRYYTEQQQDSTAPVISAISSGTPSETGTTITWTTDEDADSAVEYGLTVAYGSSEDDGTLATSHSLTLTGLTPGTTYHFRVSSSDGAGNETVSDDQTFMTAGGEDEDEDEEEDTDNDENEERSSSRRSGGSVQSRVRALEANGNTERAAELKSEYAQLFGDGSLASLQAQLAQLQARLATLTGQGTPAPVTGIRDLELDMEGEDVRSLQQLLIASGHSIPAGATSYFGSQTQAALAAYQAANGIAPASGYFGAVTRAQMKVAAHAGLWW